MVRLVWLGGPGGGWGWCACFSCEEEQEDEEEQEVDKLPGGSRYRPRVGVGSPNRRFGDRLPLTEGAQSKGCEC